MTHAGPFSSEAVDRDRTNGSALRTLGAGSVVGLLACLLAFPVVMQVPVHVVSVPLAVVVMGAPVYFGWSPARAGVVGLLGALAFSGLAVRSGSDGMDRGGLFGLAAAAVASIATARLVARMRVDVDQRQRDLVMLSARLMALQEEERRRLARELHDGLGQSLTALLSYLWLLERQLPDDQAELRTHAAEARRLATTTLADLRELAQLLRPPMLDDFGLVPSLESQVRTFGERHGIAATFTAHGLPERLPSALETAVYRITQEALANVAQHAKATRVDIVIVLVQGMLTLVVEDDGIGFQADANGGRGSGVVGMRERARALGGTVSCSSEPGARVRVQLPVAPEEPAGGAAEPSWEAPR